MAGTRQKVVSTKSLIHRDIDTGTGEILQEIEKQELVITRSVSTEEFMQIYLSDLSGMFKLESKTDIRLMSIIWRECEFNDKNSNLGNMVHTPKQIKERWAKEIGVSLSSVNNSIFSFARKELLIPQGRSMYVVNPKYFFKGFSKDQPTVLKTVLQYKLKPNEQFD